MRQPEDTRTLDAFPKSKGAGRPRNEERGLPAAQTPAQRQRAYRHRQKGARMENMRHCREKYGTWSDLDIATALAQAIATKEPHFHMWAELGRRAGWLT